MITTSELLHVTIRKIYDKIDKRFEVAFQNEIERPLEVFLDILVALIGGNIISELVVLASKALALFLESLDVTVFGLELLLQSTKLANGASLGKTSGILSTSLLVTLKELDAVLKAEYFKDHDVGAVQDEGEEESETAKVHVALRVELAGLDLHSVSTKVSSSAIAI